MKIKNINSRSLGRNSLTWPTTIKWLDNTDRKLIKQPEHGKKYCEIIGQYIKKGYLEYVHVEMIVTIVGTYPILQ